MIKRAIFLGLCLLGLLSFSHVARAACTATLPNASFGSASSFQVNGSMLPTSINLTVQCGVVLASLLTTDTISIAFSSASNPSSAQSQTVLNSGGSDNIPVNVCPSSQNCGSVLAQGGTINYSSSTLATLLSSSTFTIPIYLQTVPGQTVAAGKYQLQLNMLISWNICGLAGLDLLGLRICLNTQQGSVTLSPVLTLTVTNDCTTINAPALNFGNAPLVSALPSVTQNIAITCTKGSVYTVGIDNGQHAVNGVRYMSNGSSQIGYDLYQGTTTATRWGSIGSQRWSSATSTQLSSDQLTRTYTYLAQILGGQSTTGTGSYTDTLVVDVAF